MKGFPDIARVYLIGIGGIGMSALARYFRGQGRQVAGYDRVRGPQVTALEAEGVTVVTDSDWDAVPEAYRRTEGTLVVRTPAVGIGHPQLDRFSNGGFDLRKRSEVLGTIAAGTHGFAVAGTHGKTTTSCILAHLLHGADLPITAFLGGISLDFGSNYYHSGDTHTVVEADEFDRSFLHLRPDVACITSLDPDHLDVYGTFEEMTSAFHEFVSRIRAGGRLVFRYGLPFQGVSYGFEDGANYRIVDVVSGPEGYRFGLHTPEGIIEDLVFPKPDDIIS